LRALKERLKKGVEIIEVDAHILDDDFVKEVARVYDMMAKRTMIRQE
jgi:ketopantoate reductase